MKDTLIGVDLAKSVFQVHGASMTGPVTFCKEAVARAVSDVHGRPACLCASLLVVEACGSASYWARQMKELGHTVKLIAPQYVRPSSNGRKMTLLTLRRS